MRKIILLFLLTFSLSAKSITPNDVYAQSMIIQDHVHFLLKHYGIKHDHDAIQKQKISTKLRPRNAWQKAYEILVKINILRNAYGLSRIEPVGMEPVEELNPGMVYGMTQRILTELKIFEARKEMQIPKFKLHTYKKKTPLDVYNSFSHISASLNELNQSDLKPADVFAETMRIYDDLSVILNHLDIKDETIPQKRKENATPSDSLKISLVVLNRLAKLQKSVGIKTIDSSAFDKNNATPSDVYTVTGLIITGLQTIKAHIGLTTVITSPSQIYSKKVPADIEQLMGWNLRKVSLIKNLDRR